MVAISYWHDSLVPGDDLTPDRRSPVTSRAGFAWGGGYTGQGVAAAVASMRHLTDARDRRRGQPPAIS